MKASDVLIGVVFTLLAFLVGVLVGGHAGEDLIRDQAVVEGHAHYVADLEGRPVWKWHDGGDCMRKVVPR